MSLTNVDRNPSASSEVAKTSERDDCDKYRKSKPLCNSFPQYKCSKLRSGVMQKAYKLLPQYKRNVLYFSSKKMRVLALSFSIFAQCQAQDV